MMDALLSPSSPSTLKKVGSPRSEVSTMSGLLGLGGGRGGGGEDQIESSTFEYFGWVYHLGVNSIGHEYCHLRFLFIRGKYVEMYKHDPHENPDIPETHSEGRCWAYTYAGGGWASKYGITNGTRNVTTKE